MNRSRDGLEAPVDPGGDFDLVVAGAGPAGSAVARRTARAGMRVLLLEEHREIGVPLQCSGFVTPRTLDLAGVEEDGLVWNRVKGAWVRAPRGATLALGGERVRALALDRVEFDRRLARAAVKAGASLALGTRLVGIERQRGWLHLSLRPLDGAGASRVRTPVLVGADGWRSTVGRWLGVGRGPVVRCLSVDAYGGGPRSDMANVFVDPELAPGWFGWAIPLGQGRVRVGLGHSLTPAEPRLRERLARLLGLLRADGWEVQPLRWVGGFIPLFYSNGGRPPRIVADNVMLVGDAARQVKPTSGGGIYPGLVAAGHAAETVIGALDAGDLSADRLADYERRWEAALGAEFRREEDLRRVFLHLGGRELNGLLGLLRLPGAQQLIRRYGDIDHQSGLFVRLLGLLPALRRLAPPGLGLLGSWDRMPR